MILLQATLVPLEAQDLLAALVPPAPQATLVLLEALASLAPRVSPAQQVMRASILNQQRILGMPSCDIDCVRGSTSLLGPVSCESAIF
jgi:hypothetical protein